MESGSKLQQLQWTARELQSPDFSPGCNLVFDSGLEQVRCPLYEFPYL